MNLFSSENPNKLKESEYLYSVIDCIKIAYNLNDREFTVLKKALISTNVNIEEDVSLNDISDGLRGISTDFSKDIVGTISTIFEGLAHDKYLKCFRSKSDYTIKFSEIVFGNKTIVIDLSDIGLQEKMLSQLVFMAKFNHYVKMYKEPRLIELSENMEDSNLTTSYHVVPKIFMVNEPIQYFNGSTYTKIHPFEVFKYLMQSLQSLDNGLILKTAQIGKISGLGIQTICSSFIGLKTNDHYSKAHISQLLQLDDYHTDRRESSYQIAFLEKLADNAAILKRDDQNFPFPIIIDTNIISKLKKPSEEEIITHMNFGESLYEKSQELIIKNAYVTDIEKNFGNFSWLILKIIDFLSEMDKIPFDSAYSKPRCMDLLKNCVDILLEKTYGNDKVVRQARKDIFELCIKHGYLEITYKDIVEGSANAQAMYKGTDKIKQSIEEYLELGSPSKIVSTEYQLDEERDIISEVEEEGDFEDFQNNTFLPENIAVENNFDFKIQNESFFNKDPEKESFSDVKDVLRDLNRLKQEEVNGKTNFMPMGLISKINKHIKFKNHAINHDKRKNNHQNYINSEEFKRKIIRQKNLFKKNNGKGDVL